MNSKTDVDRNSAATLCSPRRCERCRDLPLLYFDEQMRGWDCVHVCGDRFYGAVNQPNREVAVAEWNSLA